MEATLTAREQAYVAACRDEEIELIRELCGIPAPSHQEEKRAEFCLEWLKRAGAKGAYLDEAKNVVCPIGEPSGNMAVFTAHTDTVFPDREPMPWREENGRLYSPGVGDDTANLAALLLTARYLLQNRLAPAGGALFVCNSCEEGLGNLKGVRQIMRDYAGKVGYLVSFDGYSTGICGDAVGSKRYRVEILTEGGHSYGKFGNRNAIHYLSSMIAQLYTMKVPDLGSKTTYNVGQISGGTSVNTIAQQAEMLYEYRSDRESCLKLMDEFFAGVVASYRAMGVQVNVELLGERPCTGPVPREAQQALIHRAAQVLRAAVEREPAVSAGSTDCNIPLSLGIPAVCFGTCQGGGAHTRGEWIDRGSLPDGLAAAMMMALWDCAGRK